MRGAGGGLGRVEERVGTLSRLDFEVKRERKDILSSGGGSTGRRGVSRNDGGAVGVVEGAGGRKSKACKDPFVRSGVIRPPRPMPC